MRFLIFIFFASLWAGSVFAEPAFDAASSGARTIAVVRDGDSAYFNEMAQKLGAELEVLLGPSLRAIFLRDAEFVADWSALRAREALQHALEDRRVDIVLAIGPLATMAAAAPELSLRKPVVCGFAPDQEVITLPVSPNGRSGKTNLNFTLTPMRMRRDLEMFRELTAFRVLGVVLDRVWVEDFEVMQRLAVELERQFGIKIKALYMEQLAADVLAQVDDTVDAVYLTPCLRADTGEWQKLIAGLNARKKPTFSMLGHDDVARGVLAALTLPIEDRLVRRLALNLHEIMLGAKPESLPVVLHVDEDLLINALTARQVGFHPTLDVMIEGNFLHEENLDAVESLALVEAVQEAVRCNIELTIKRSEVEQARQERALALSPLLPQVEGVGQYYRMDRDRAEMSLGAQPRDKSTAGISASQVLFSDALLSRRRAVARLYEGELNDQESLRLDIVAAAAQRYLDFLQAQSLLRVEAGNLGLTRNNLALARLRHKVGAAGPEEICRWESEQALRRASLLRASANMEKARVVVNQTMGRAQSARWRAPDIELRDDDFLFLGPRFKALLADERQLVRLEQFAVNLALRRSPSLAAAERRIQALVIEHNQARRRFVLPELSASFGYDRVLKETKIGAPDFPGSDDLSDDDEWLFGLRAALPILTGGGRIFETRRLAAKLQQARDGREQLRQMLEQRARLVFHSLNSSFPNIRLQRVAAERAEANLGIVRQKYADGSVPIIALLDAQNEVFAAKQGAAVAAYQYMSDLIEFQRAIAWFEIEQSEAEKDRWLAELEEFFKHNP